MEIALFVGFSFFLIPLSYYPAMVDPGLSLRFGLLAALIAVSTIVRFFRSSVSPQEPVQEIPRIFIVFCAGYCIVSLLSIIPAVNKSEAVFEIAKVFLFCAYIWLASTMIPRFLNSIHSIANAVTLSSLIIATLGVVEYWGIFSLIDNGKVSPGVTMFNRNLLSSFLFLCLGFVLFVIFAGRGRVWRFFGVLAYAEILYMLFATQTRAVWLGCLGGFLCTIIITAAVRLPLLLSFVRSNRGIISVCAILPFIVIIAVSILKPAKTEQPLSLNQRLATIVDPEFESNNQRIILWRKTICMSMEHPLLGVGAGNWKIALPRYGINGVLDPDMGFTETRPYNDFLWVLAETGIFGLVSYAGLFLISALFCLRSLRMSHERIEVLCAVLLLFSLIGFAIISLFDFPKERVEHLTLLGCIFALCASIGAGSSSPSGNQFQRARWQRHTLTGTSLVCALTCQLIGAVRFQGDINGSVMRRLWQKQEWQKAIAAADRASSALYTMDPTSTPLLWYRGVANFRLGNIDRALLDHRQAHTSHPWHVRVLNDLGTCYNLTGDQKRAMACYSDALSLSPFFETALINLAAIYYNSGRYDQAYSVISRCKLPHTDSRFESFFQTISLKINKRGGP